MTYESHAASEARIDVRALVAAVVRRLPRIILVTLGLLAATFVFLMFQPRLYESSASILVEPRSNIYMRPANEQAPVLSGNEAGVVSSQIELLKSRDTLVSVIDRLDLRSVPEFNGSGGGFSPMGLIGQLLGRGSTPSSIDETVLNNLNERLTVAQERDSRIISVSVQSTDPQLAAQIANAVANAHVTRRAQLSLSDTVEASGWLAEEIAKLRVSVSEAESAVADFRVQNDLFLGANNTSLADQELSTIVGQINAAQERKNTALSRANLIRNMIERGVPLEGVGDVRQSVIIQQLTQEKGGLQSERAQRSATLLANHPAILALNAQIAELDNQIRLEARRVAEALEAEAQIEADLEASLRNELVTAKGSASTATQDNVTLVGLEREAAAQRGLLEGYLQRYNEAVSRTDVNSALPDVRVVSVAAPSVTPASPKTQLILMAVALVALAGQVGAVAFGELMSGRALVPLAPAPRAQDELEQVPFSEDELEPDQRWVEEEEEVAEPELETGTAEVAVAPVIVAQDTPIQIEPVVVDVLDKEEVAAREARERFMRMLSEVNTSDTPEQVSDEPANDEPGIEEIAPVAVAVMPSVPTVSNDTLSAEDLASDLVLGRTNLMMLSGYRSNEECEALAEDLVRNALSAGLSVALVDAGSARPSEELGLTDLSRGEASFGDVVQKSSDNTFAEVSWGCSAKLKRKSMKPATLIEALGDIYEVVVVMTGPVGSSSSLPLFSEIDARVILVTDEEANREAVAAACAELADDGFEDVEVAAIPAMVAA
jgi:succinoglycan biosynthesis transport protein ExoP